MQEFLVIHKVCERSFRT